jgi:hypothetical protein
MGEIMKKVLILIGSLFFIVSSMNTSFADANGYAVVNPETGVVHGVISADSDDPFNNGGVMPVSYMGCPEGCLIVKQSTSDNSGNVSGMHGENVTYSATTERFTVLEQNTVSSDIVSSTQSNTELVETSVNVYNYRVYDFGIQDLKNQESFELNEVVLDGTNPAKVTAEKNTWNCLNNSQSCVKNNTLSKSNEILESILLKETRTNEQLVVEFYNKQLNILLANINKVILKLQKLIL